MKQLFKMSLVSSALLLATGAYAAGPSNAQLQSEVKLLMHKVAHLEGQVHSSGTSIAMRTANHSRHVRLLGHGMTVTTSPWLGKKTVGDASDLLEQTSKSNLQLTLLQKHSNLIKHLKSLGAGLWRPMLELSGGIEGQMYNINGYGSGTTPRGIALNTAEIDMAASVGPWANAFIALDYNNASPAQGLRPLQRGTIYLRDAFVTIGNLNKLPVYGTIGQLRVPFGRYSSMMISSPLTQTLGDTRATAALLGYAHHGIYGSVYGFSGNRTTGGQDLFKQGGFDVGYKSHFGANNKNHYQAGVSVMSNLADSNGMQDNGLESATAFNGFNQTPSSAAPTGNALSRNTPALSVYGKAGWNKFTFIGEYVTALRKFAASDLQFGSSAVINNNNGADPKALHLEVNYTIQWKAYPVTFGAAYGHSWESLALNMPENSYTLDAQSSFWRNTVETLEYRHTTDYSTSEYASGRGAVANTQGTGKNGNAVTAQLGVYF